MSFSNNLLQWFNEYKRDLPWKKTNDAYKIWLSEIILQQTRVNQGLPYYLKFVEKFPTVHKLANADIDEVLKLWEGLGYYSRARNLHHTAKVVSKVFKGKFPETIDEIKKLKGIGPYTAAAILSFAFNKPYPAIDGNAYRITSRYLGIINAIDETSTKKEIETWLNKIISKDRPGDFNQAMMDLGSSVCTPKKPLCNDCPLNKNCVAFKNDLISIIPFKSKTITKKERHFHYFIIIDQFKNTLIRKRNEKDIWIGLYEFPLLENDSSSRLKGLKIKKNLKDFINDEIEISQIDNSEEVVHILTHQKLKARFYQIFVKSLKNKKIQDNCYLVNLENISTFAFPKLIQFYIEANLK